MILRFLTSILSFTFIYSGAFAQKLDTTYYDNNWVLTTKALSSYFRVTKTLAEGNKYEVVDYYNSGKIQMTGIYSSLDPEIKDGEFNWYKEDGKRTAQTIYELGKIKVKRHFEDSLEPHGANMLDSLEKQSLYPGGMNKLYRYIAANFEYPKGLKPRPKGRIKICFIIRKDGSPSEVYAKETLHPLLDAEAVRVVEQMPKWQPGILKGKPVNVIYEIPLKMD